MITIHAILNKIILEMIQYLSRMKVLGLKIPHWRNGVFELRLEVELKAVRVEIVCFLGNQTEA